MNTLTNEELREYVAVPSVPNSDARRMQPLPWRRERHEKSDDMVSVSRKIIATFFGNKERHPQDLSWCTEEQRNRHIDYAIHTCNKFPIMQGALEKLYYTEGMPPEALSLIENIMKECYRDEIPIYSNTGGR